MQLQPTASKHKLQTCRSNLAHVTWMRLDLSCQWRISVLQAYFPLSGPRSVVALNSVNAGN